MVQKLSVPSCGILFDLPLKPPAIFFANQKKRDVSMDQEENSKASLEPTLAKEIVQSSCNAIKSKLIPKGDVIMTATSLGAGWDLFSFGEPRPDLAFLEPGAAKIWGSLECFSFTEKKKFKQRRKLRISK